MTAEQLETFLASGLLGAKLQGSVDRFHAVRAQLFERCKTVADWRGAFAQLRRMQSTLPASLRLPAAGVPDRDIQAWEGAIKRIIELCRGLFDDQNRSIGDHIKRLLDVLSSVDEYNIRKTEQEVLERIRQVLDQLAEGRSMALSTAEFGEVLNGLVQERAQEEDESDDPSWHHILLVSPESVDNLQRKVVFFLGVDNVSFPRAFTDPWPFAQADIRDHQLQERYLFLAVLRAAKERLHLSFPQVEHAHNRRPSMYLAAAAELLNIDLSQPADVTGNEANVTELDNPETEPMGQARRDTYTLFEIAQFSLCPYRYKLERISPDARSYKSVWQLRFAAHGQWINRILTKLQADGQSIKDKKEDIQDWLRDSVRKTQPLARKDFPSLRDGEWITVRKRVYEDMVHLIDTLATEKKFPIRFVPFGNIRYDLVDDEDRTVQIVLDGRHAYQRGKLIYPYDRDTLIESWLQYGRQPDTEEDQPIETRVINGVRVYVHQYDAIQWWRKINRDWFTLRRNKNKIPDFKNQQREVLDRVRVIESGRYPKNPGDHCMYCPLQSDCLGLKP